MPHRFGCIAQFYSNSYLVNRHIGWAKHRAKVTALLIQVSSADVCCFKCRLCLTAITSASRGRSSATEMTPCVRL